MPFDSGAKADIKMGFWLGVGLVLLGLLFSLARAAAGKVAGRGG